MNTQTPPTNHVLFSALTETVWAGDCVVIIGAGVSAGDYPLWEELISILEDRCKVRPEDLQDTHPLYVAEIAKTKGKVYYDVLDEQFGRKDNPKSLGRYHLLAQITFANYITLNFDPLLLDTLDLHRNVTVSQYPELQNQRIGKREIFYVHGRLGPDRPASHTPIVLTRTEFDDAYDPDKNTLHSFLQSTFRENDVCFIGCNPQEENMRHLLEACHVWSENMHGLCDNNRPHWFLLWDGDSESPAGMAECGIHVVHYSKSDTQFSGLDRVLEYWAKKKEPVVRKAGVDRSPFDPKVEPEQ